MLNDSLQLNRAFSALSDPFRRGMLARLSQGPASVSELASPLPISLPAVLQHLKALEASGLVASEKKGRVRTVRMQAEALSAAEAWLVERRREWEARLDRFEDYVSTLKNGEE
jgi:DNA-binding transcriptional ArsR family regulator